MLKKAFILGVASLAGLPLYLFPHPHQVNWINAALLVAAVCCLVIGLSRRP